MNVELYRLMKIVGNLLAATALLLLVTNCGSGANDEPKPLSEGERLTIGDTVETDTGTIAIRSFEALTTAEDDEVQPRDGFSFAVIELKGCVSSGQNRVMTIYATDVQLQLADGSLLVPTRSVRDPSLQPLTHVEGGDCASGHLTYKRPELANLAKLRFAVVEDKRIFGFGKFLQCVLKARIIIF